jgi:hypothetical protein
LNLLEAIRFLGQPIRYYSAGSSECFGDNGDVPSDESTPFRPRSPYAVAKSAAYWQVANYREAYGLFACSGILFNHESPLRPERFVTQKIVRTACRIAAGSRETLQLGNLDIHRDWGWAPEYVHAMWLMLQQPTAAGFRHRHRHRRHPCARRLRCRNLQRSRAGLARSRHQRPTLMRPTDLRVSRANPARAETVLGWKARATHAGRGACHGHGRTANTEMNITIIGTGYVGLVTGTCLADLGNSVCCLDIDPAKIATLNSGGVPIHEPGLGALIQSNVEAGRLRFTTDVADAVAFGDVQFIAVGTPPDEDGSADLQYVLAAARNIGRHMTGFKVVVDKSTVPVGTADKVRAAIQAELGARGVSEHTGFSVVSNPEFLKEGAAVDDFMRPDRIVLGVDATPEGQRALALMRQLYLPFNRNHERTRVMDVKAAPNSPNTPPTPCWPRASAS